MPSFSDIQKEIQEEAVPDTTYDRIRRKYLKKLSEKTGRNTIWYYSGWLQKPIRSILPLVSITDNDKNGFMSVLKGLDVSKGLDIILHTPGGDIAATESLIDYLNQKFEGNMRAIVPQLAMSGGTIIACACREILMGKQSSLGPIDPQINGLSASGIVSEFYHANKEIKQDSDKMNVWGPIITGYHPSLIETCKKAISWSKELAYDYLSGSMFRDELEPDNKYAKTKIDNIIRLLTDQNLTKSHARHIPTPICKDIGLKIIEMEKDQDLQDIILSVHHASTLTIMNTSAVKIIENQNSQAYISTYSKST